MHFARLLRRAGLRVGPDRVIEALRALAIVGVERRDDVYWALAAVFIDRHEHLQMFAQAFDWFWREHLAAAETPALSSERSPDGDQDALAIEGRLAQAIGGGVQQPLIASQPEAPNIIAAQPTEVERLKRLDFAAMSLEEAEKAKRLIATMRLPIAPVATRRFRVHAHGDRVDVRNTLRASLRGHSEVIPLIKRKRLRRPPPLIILCDVSRSMSTYTRMFLHFMHAVSNDRDRVSTFAFGTRLTNITRQLRHRDVDAALGAVASTVLDWSGGTRIGSSLHEFNRKWSRRVLGQRAAVLLVTDGLDRDIESDLKHEMALLKRACHPLIWLNPLLRYRDFEPRAQGIRIMRPFVDAFISVHNIDSLTAIGQAFASHAPKTS